MRTPSKLNLMPINHPFNTHTQQVIENAQCFVTCVESNFPESTVQYTSTAHTFLQAAAQSSRRRRGRACTQVLLRQTLPAIWHSATCSASHPFCSAACPSGSSSTDSSARPSPATCVACPQELLLKWCLQPCAGHRSTELCSTELCSRAAEGLAAAHACSQKNVNSPPCQPVPGCERFKQPPEADPQKCTIISFINIPLLSSV